MQSTEKCIYLHQQTRKREFLAQNRPQVTANMMKTSVCCESGGERDDKFI